MKLSTTMVAAALAALPVAAHAGESGYPTKPIRLVIGSAAGSGPDIISRLLSERLYKTWGQRVVVDARPGVAGVISADIVTRSATDGYTWMMLTSQLFVATSVYKGLKFNLDEDFTSVAMIGTVPFVLLANPQLPAKSVADLIAMAKKQPGNLRYGSAGAGASEHLCGVMLTTMSGTNMLHVPYKGVGQAIADTIAREVHFTFAVAPAAKGQVEGGRLRALGVSTAKRSDLFPGVPAIGETLPAYQMFGWYSIVMPKGVPDSIVNMVSKEIVTAVKEPQFGAQLKNLGVEIVGSGRAEFDKFRRSERKRISELVKASGVDVKL